MTYYCQKCGRQQDYTACPHCTNEQMRIVANKPDMLDPRTITSYDIWHPVNGRWVHLAMTRNSDGEPVHYTDGVQENVEDNEALAN